MNEDKNNSLSGLKVRQFNDISRLKGMYILNPDTGSIWEVQDIFEGTSLFVRRQKDHSDVNVLSIPSAAGYFVYEDAPQVSQ
jgi:hypothetical protein